MTRNKKSLQLIIYAAAWTGFLLLPFVAVTGPGPMPFHPEKKVQWLFFTTNLFLIGFYYLHSLVFIPKLLAKRKIGLYIISIVSMLVLLMLIPIIYFQLVALPDPFFVQDQRLLSPHNSLRQNRPGGKRILFFSFPATLLMFLLMLIISGGIKIINQWFKSERRTEEIAREQLSTELALLKSQINPHFLFNTLNNIYALAVVNSADTANAVLKLSAIMRYVLEEAKINVVALEKDLAFIENYISLQRVRLTEKSLIHFTVSGNTAGKQIAPLLLIAFVENAFKYGISTHQSSVIDISVNVSGNELRFLVSNQKFNTAHNNGVKTGIGLTNARRRLELMYNGKHSLVIDDMADTFLITLIIDLV